MELVRWTPEKQLIDFHKRFNSIFDDAFFPGLRGGAQNSLQHWHPAVDIFDTETAIVVKAELPGVEKDNIQIDVKDGVLTLKGERNSENEVKEDGYYRKERSYGTFQRAFTLPNDVNPDTIKADYKDGVLKIEIPKPEEKKPRRISVH